MPRAGASASALDRSAEAPSAPVLEFRGMTKRFGGTLALDDVHLEVRPGEILALLGENGAGKSTLIKILAGVHAPDAGAMRIRGRPYDPRVERAAIAFIHQDLGLIDWMTVAENIALAQGYPRRFGLIDWDAVEARAQRSLARVATGIHPQQRVQDLSRTEKSLVAIARALEMQADLLVLDEPTASLPLDEVEILFEALRGLRARGVAMIYVSHRLDEVYRIADRLAVLRDGRLVAMRETAARGAPLWTWPPCRRSAAIPATNHLLHQRLQARLGGMVVVLAAAKPSAFVSNSSAAGLDENPRTARRTVPTSHRGRYWIAGEPVMRTSFRASGSARGVSVVSP
jgi:ABC-type multidrug transport system ATPase subunit